MKPKTKLTKRQMSLKNVEHWMTLFKTTVPSQAESRAIAFKARNARDLRSVVDEMSTTQLRAVLTFVNLGYAVGSHETREFLKYIREAK